MKSQTFYRHPLDRLNGETLKCPRCNGTGEILLPPFYATKMPEPVKVDCFDCGGVGYFLVVPDRIKVIRKSQLKLADY